MGLITRYLSNLSPGFNFVSTLLGAVLLWDFFTRVMHGITIAFLEDVWSRNFLNFFATPLSISEYLLERRGIETELTLISADRTKEKLLDRIAKKLGA